MGLSLLTHLVLSTGALVIPFVALLVRKMGLFGAFWRFLESPTNPNATTVVALEDELTGVEKMKRLQWL